MSANGYAKEVLVTTDWLAEHLNDPGLVVAEVDENPDLYDEEHIPGAINIPLKMLTREIVSSLVPDHPIIVYCWDYQ